jgi:hypothetical protein
VFPDCPCASTTTTPRALLFRYHYITCHKLERSPSHFTTYSQSVSQSVRLGVEPLWDLWPDITSCLKVAVLSLWGALSNERMGLQFAVQSLNCPSRAELITILFCLMWDSPNLEGQVPCLYPPGTWWPSYIPGNWFPWTPILVPCFSTNTLNNAHLERMGVILRKKAMCKFKCKYSVWYSPHM